jgi:hypothetical protein
LSEDSSFLLLFLVFFFFVRSLTSNEVDMEREREGVFKLRGSLRFVMAKVRSYQRQDGKEINKRGGWWAWVGSNKRSGERGEDNVSKRRRFAVK